MDFDGRSSDRQLDSEELKVGDFPKLSPRQERIIMLVGQAKSDAEIAKELYISIGTVHTHLKEIYRRLHATSRMEAWNTWLKQSQSRLELDADVTASGTEPTSTSTSRPAIRTHLVAVFALTAVLLVSSWITQRIYLPSLFWPLLSITTAGTFVGLIGSLRARYFKALSLGCILLIACTGTWLSAKSFRPIYNDDALIEVLYWPDSVKAGSRFECIIRVTNTGSNVWTFNKRCRLGIGTGQKFKAECSVKPVRQIAPAMIGPPSDPEGLFDRVEIPENRQVPPNGNIIWCLEAQAMNEIGDKAVVFQMVLDTGAPADYSGEFSEGDGWFGQVVRKNLTIVK